MKSLKLVEIIESVLRWEQITTEEYDKGASIVESILVNNNIKLLDTNEVFNQLLLKLFERKNSYQFDITVYQRWNYIIKYLIKSMQEVVQISKNIVDIPLYIIEKGSQYVDEIYELNPEIYFCEDFHEQVEKNLLINYLKETTTPKENYVLQRSYIDWVKKKDVAKELKVKPKKISSMLNRIRNKATSIWLNQY